MKDPMDPGYHIEKGEKAVDELTKQAQDIEALLLHNGVVITNLVPSALLYMALMYFRHSGLTHEAASHYVKEMIEALHFPRAS